MATGDDAGRDSWNAGLYDNSFAFIWEYGSNLIDLLDPQPGETVLDLGCGTGHLTHAIAERGAQVIGADFSPAMIEQARTNYPDLRFEVADASDFTLDEPVDAIFSNAVFHWVRDQEGAADSVARALKPGGRFVAEFGGKHNVGQIIAATVEAMREAGYPDGAKRNPWYYPSIAEHATLLERHGLETTSAVLFDRPTLLEGGAAGLALWLEMFGDSFFAGIPESDRKGIVTAVEDRLRPLLFRDGSWYADYRRLRIVARRVVNGSR
ncbi:MAG TPA: methyltransferase domain-containing protein [Nitrolancea sp.]|nr:methyltransferase domain-containing protein [Nitrolancea sp.]